MKSTLTILLPLLMAAPAFASDINAQNLQGVYRLDAHAFTKSATFRLRVLANSEFEVQRIFADHDGKICNGKYTVEREKRIWPMKDATVFKGFGSCPDDRSKTADFKINFKDLSLKDISSGATVVVTSSMAAGMSVNAQMRRDQ